MESETGKRLVSNDILKIMIYITLLKCVLFFLSLFIKMISNRKLFCIYLLI